MPLKPRQASALAFAFAVLLNAWAAAQPGEVFTARMTSLPTDAAGVSAMRGSGKVVAELRGNSLVIKGEFKGMSSPVTAAHVHRAQKGLRGPSAFDLTVANASESGGTLEKTLTLTAAQIADLKRGWYYVQIHTQANPEGHLRGWLLQ